MVSSFIETIFLVYYAMKIDGVKNIDRGLVELIIILLAQVFLLGFFGYLSYQTEDEVRTFPIHAKMY